MKLTHIGISQFRSIGSEPVMIDLDKKITLLVGQNDCGKSNVLRGVEWISKLRDGLKGAAISKIDFHGRSTDPAPTVRLVSLTTTSNEIEVRKLGKVTIDASLSANLDRECICREIEPLDYWTVGPVLNEFGLRSTYMQPQPGETVELIKKASLFMAQSLREFIPRFQVVPQYRKIDATAAYAVDGTGVIKLLANWQHPEIGSDHLRQKFDHVEKLLRELLERPNVAIEVPHTQKEILVRDGDLRLPLESHGTGVHQLIILAIAVLSQDEVIFGIEEPEIHLHPILQRRFLEFLKNETTNRYIITTHSPSLIAPAADVDVIHLKMVDGVTVPTRISTDAGTLAALDDLGIRPSDLLQANCVVWVEGPSDRIYIKRWLKILAPELVEGIDYSLMFYGGRLLSHLTMERESDHDLTSFVQLLRINQYSALVMDSDRTKSADPLNATKQRIIDECEKNGLHCWVTAGREIENYLTPRTVEAALKEHGQLRGEFKLKEFGKFDASMKQAVGEEAPGWCDYSLHKTAWAHRIAPHIGGDDSDITIPVEKGVDALRDFIRARRGSAPMVSEDD